MIVEKKFKYPKICEPDFDENLETVWKDYEILWARGPCDSITIFYVDWLYLCQNKLVNIELNYEHIRLISF